MGFEAGFLHECLRLRAGWTAVCCRQPSAPAGLFHAFWILNTAGQYLEHPTDDSARPLPRVGEKKRMQELGTRRPASSRDAAYKGQETN